MLVSCSSLGIYLRAMNPGGQTAHNRRPPGHVHGGADSRRWQTGTQSSPKAAFQATPEASRPFGSFRPNGATGRPTYPCRPGEAASLTSEGHIPKKTATIAGKLAR